MQSYLGYKSFSAFESPNVDDLLHNSHRNATPDEMSLMRTYIPVISPRKFSLP